MAEQRFETAVVRPDRQAPAATSSRLNTPFLTDLDPREAVKGSRDPLGIQQIWTRLGRHVVGNLTTITDSVTDFAVTMLGYHFAACIADEDPKAELRTFLKWEQLASYARAYVNRDRSFRGTRHTYRNLEDGNGKMGLRVTLSDDRAHQLLGNQRMYGLWGMYSMPARESGLLNGEPARLTPEALELVEEVYLPKLATAAGKDCRLIVQLMRGRATALEVDGAHKALLVSVAKLLKGQFSPRERSFYRDHLLHGGPLDATSGLQAQLAAVLEADAGNADFQWSTSEVERLSREAEKHGAAWQPLADRLDRIAAAEKVLAPASAIFSYLLGMRGTTVEAAVRRLSEALGPLRTIDCTAFTELRDEISAGEAGAGDSWVLMANALHAGKYDEVLEAMLARNRKVTAARGGAAWIEVEGGCLNVRALEESGSLPDRREISGLWRYPYFLESVRRIGGALQAH